MKLNINKLCHERIVVFDGAMGTSIQEVNLSRDDFWGKDGCNEILNLSSPEAIQKIHADFLKVGCDFIETNTFGANGVILNEYNLADKIYEINFAAAKLARKVANDFSENKKQRYVAGSIGPGTKLPSLRQISFKKLQQAYIPQIEGLIDGGVDLLIIETSQDLLQLKAVVIAINEIFKKNKMQLPVQAQVTIETTGKMLVGTDMQTVIVTMAPLPIDVLGINCSTGPKPMTGHLRTLSQHWSRLISVMPNAGLPIVENGNIFYDLTPEELALDLKYFITELGVNIVGGCCGTKPEHLKAVVEAVSNLSPKKREPSLLNAAASLYSISEFKVEPKPLIIGERCNANGSKNFREFLLNNNTEGMISVAQQQERELAHLLDICTAYVGLDEEKITASLVERLNTDVTLPLMIDSTRPSVIESALQRIAGKAIINSVNLEDDDLLREILLLCKKYGAAVVALTIDQQGMAKTADRKIEIARRLYKIITEEFKIAPEDIFLDTLTFTLGSGDEETRTAAIETMTAIREIKEALPAVNTILGVSNISFGLKPVIRHRLNSVFLAHAIEAGLDAAILHAGKIIPLYKIHQNERKLFDDLIFNRRSELYDPLIETIKFYKDKTIKTDDEETLEFLPIEERLQKRILDGNQAGLAGDLDECLQSYPAIKIINKILLEAMKQVGEFFESGEMQLPFVLQSAETMKAAVSHLQPHLKKIDGQSKGKILLATVKGDVHDIGKNLVDIILSNNGYEVINLGIKQTVESIIQTLKETKADAVGMSGLLVKSTIIMKENLETMNQLGINIPVLLGGAALTRTYVESELRKIYAGDVYYAKDAFEGLSLMGKIVSGKSPQSKIKMKNNLPVTPEIAVDKIDKQKKIQPVKPPETSFWGRRVVKGIPVSEIIPFLNKKALFMSRWQLSRKGQTKAEYKKILQTVLEPKFNELVEKADLYQLITPKLVYGYFPCNSEGNDLFIYQNKTDKTPIVIFNFPRQKMKNGFCIADYFLPLNSGSKDVIGMHVVTAGKKASEESQRLFENNKFQDYLFWHGFSVEFAEALAEYWHKQIRRELGIDSGDAPEIKKLFSGHYQGARYSFGYAACPNLEDQVKLFQLLKPEEISVSLTEEYQMVPEQSTSAIIVHHPQAKYFSI